MKIISKIRAGHKEERGETLLEFALSAVVVFMLLFGIMEFSRAMYIYHFMSYAAQAGTRYAAVRGSSWSKACASPTSSSYSGVNISADCYASADNIKGYIMGITPPGVDLKSLTITPKFCGNVASPSAGCTTWTSGSTITAAGVDCTASSTTGVADNPGCLIQVAVSYKFTFIVPFWSQTPSLTASSMQIIQQ
ncbi:MAG TPA: TadE family protein [Acidobacteriaceae bacterium]|nr:TadE family protein [Acidobacteriaceae bacterium]